MRIGLHLGTLRGLGSANVGRNVLNALLAANTGHTFWAWVPGEWQLGEGGVSPSLFVHNSKPGLLNKLVTENVVIRRTLRRWRADRLFSMGDTSTPACPVPHLVLVQQAYLARHLDDFDFPMPPAFRAKLALMQAYFRASLSTASAFTVQTEYMRRRLHERWGYPLERIVVVPSSVDGWIASSPGHHPTDDPPYVCYVSSAGPHKNHALLATMMSRLAVKFPALRCKLTVHPSTVPELIAAAGIRGVLDAFDFLGPLPPKGAIELLRGATALVSPSKLESFGLPYYEAMAVGCPVVASDRPFAREACGDAGLYADDHGEAFAAEVEMLLDDSAAARAASVRCRRRFEDIYVPWEGVAKRYVEVLEELE